MWLLLAFVALPLVEIGLFVTLGAWLGLWPTLAWVLASAALGLWVIRRQGERANIAMRQGFASLSEPLSPMASGALTVAAGILLVLPGFLTDAVGLLLLLPPVRALIIAALSRRIVVTHAAAGRTQSRPDIIDGEFIELDAQTLPPRPDGAARSGWVQE